MKNVLIVDDERPFLISLSDALSTYAGELNVLTARNGLQALTVLERTKVDLIVTDLRMPEMDGFDLLAALLSRRYDIPVIVMTAFGTPEIEARLKTLGITQFIEKPVDFDELQSKIMDELAASSEGYINGITLAAFLQLVDMEKKTCTLTIRSEGRVGYLYFLAGDIIAAETGGRTGDEAAYDIVTWDHVSIEIEGVCRKREKTIHLPLSQVLMEGFRLKDERLRPGGNARPAADHNDDEIVFDLSDTGAERPASTLHHEEDTPMALEKYLESLKEIKGYRAAGIMNYTGEMLVYDTQDPHIDLGIVGATFNDIFRSAHEASTKIGLEACKETVINTPKGVVIMRCSGVDAPVHFHLISILAADGNQALMKMQIEKLVGPILQELS